MTFETPCANDDLREDGPDDPDRIALFLDVDGTLLDLAARPEDVVVPHGLVAALAAAEAALGGALALISGRPIVDLDRLFAPLRLRAAGVHGAELRLDPRDATTTASGVAAFPADLRTALNALLGDFPETFSEDKRYSIAVHYRQAPEAREALRIRLARLLEAFPETGITMLEAHFAYELKSQRFDKGRAVGAFLAAPPFHGRTPIFVGDDDTDETGFAAVAAVGGRAYSVGRRRPFATSVFPTPLAVRGWLAALARQDASA